MSKVTKKQLKKDSSLIYEYLIENNDEKYNSNKFIEEIFELGESFTKFNTKNKDNRDKPSIDDVIAEFSDVCIRGVISIRQLGNLTEAEFTSKSNTAAFAKLNKLIGYIEANKYKGGV